MTARPLHPEFAVEAHELLASSRALDAIRICIGGIDQYPQYAGGYVMLAKAYVALGRIDDASALLRDISLRFPHVTVDLTRQDSTALDEGQPDEGQEAYPVVQDVPEHDVNTVPESPVVGASADEHQDVESLPEEADEDDEDVTEEFLAEELTERIVDHLRAATAPANVLRMIETVPVADDVRIIRSSSVRLIPGLEFTTLRVEGIRSRGRRGIGSLPEPPPFRSFHAVRRPQRPVEPALARKPVSLEELAMRLTDAKMPRPSESDATVARTEPLGPQQQPILVTDTIATIYMQQQSYDLAIEAFKTLMSRKPDRKEHYEALIRECERKRG